MKMGFQQAKQPSQGDVQSLLNLLNTGQLPQAETTARALLKIHPNALIFHNVLGISLEGQKKFEEAVASYRRALSIEPKIAEIHFNLGVVLSNLGKLEEAVASYRKAVNLKPTLAVAYFNLGIVLQELGRLEEAVPNYRKTIALEPGFFEAHGNLGAVLQEQGKLDEAVACYQKALVIHADAKGYFNLGTALRNQGKLDEAITCYHKALALDPNYVEAHSNLGEALFDQGKSEEAVVNYRKALAIAPHNAEANYNLGIFLYDSGNLEQAIPYFEKSQIRDWRERTLYCLYKTEKYAEFKEQLQHLVTTNNTSPFLATLSAHHAVNFGVEDQYAFCKNPLDFVYHGKIDALATPDSELLSDLLRDINFAEIAERKQGRLHHGIQSSGNLFKRPEASFKKLSALVKQSIEAYRAHFSGQDCVFMKAFPKDIEFSSSWFVKMRTGGHLTSHIHETGWLSGSLYLAMPPREANSEAGSIEFSTHGDNYPQKHANFPKKAIAPSVGDIVLFPSSLFHRTIPFSSNEERICIAFDLKPIKSLLANSGFKVLLLGWLYAWYAEIIEFALLEKYLLA